MGSAPSATTSRLAYDGTVTLAALGAEVDPVEGGSCNDYDYVAGDPVNNFDLDGTHCQRTKTVTDKKSGKKKTVSHDGHWNSWGCKGARAAAAVGRGAVMGGRAVGRAAVGTGRAIKCVASELAPWNYGKSSLVEAGAAIGSAGVTAITYTGGGAFVPASTGALVTGVPILVAGASIAAYGGYHVYKACS